MNALPVITASMILVSSSMQGAPTFSMPQLLTHVGGDHAQAKQPKSNASSRKAQLATSFTTRGRGTPRDEATGITGSESLSSARPCPAGMVAIGTRYCIDMFEAALVEVSGGQEQPWSPFVRPDASKILRAVSQPGVYPQGYISGLEAKSACEASGKRLCKSDEWRQACMGPNQSMWGYGQRKEAKRCNDHGRSGLLLLNPGLTDRPEDRWKWGANGNMMDSRLNQLEGTLAKTGEHSNCTNEYGVFDMVGNLHEWVDDPNGTFQGGYYLDTHLNGDGCYYKTTAHPMSHSDYSTGFRCCSDMD